MVTVSTKQQLADCIKAREKQIRVVGSLAKEMRRRRKLKKGAIIGGALTTVGGLIALPFTGGASAPVVAYGLTAAGATVGSLTISTAELAILCGTALAAYGIYKGAKVIFNSDGSVTIEPKY